MNAAIADEFEPTPPTAVNAVVVALLSMYVFLTSMDLIWD
jgi:hypothetical protein